MASQPATASWALSGLNAALAWVSGSSRDFVERRGELASLSVRNSPLLRGQHLHGDVVRALVEVLTDPADHRIDIAPRDQRFEGVQPPCSA